MTRYLVTVEDNGTIVAGIYVESENKDQALLDVRLYLDRCKLIAWPDRIVVKP